MSALDQAIDLEEVIRVLVSVGIDEAHARDQFAALDNDAARLSEVCALAVESDAGLLLSADLPPTLALFELVEGLRQAGLQISLGQCANGAVGLALGAARNTVYEVQIDEGAPLGELACALASVVPRSHQLLLALGYESGDALPALILDRGSYVWFSAAVGDGALDRLFSRPAAEHPHVRVIECDALVQPDFAERYKMCAPDADAAQDLDALFAQVRGYDPRVPWPSESRRPPGDDFFELCGALSAAPLCDYLASHDDAALANVLYQFALATLVGASCDLLAARNNPGMSAQGVLGFGQLNWSWFIFDALGAVDEAARASTLLDHDWVRIQERGRVAARQRAYYDLALQLRTGKRGPALLRLSEHVALLERAAFGDPQSVEAAVAAHCEPLGDQLTHHPLYHVWPAPLYALARRAGMLASLPADNPFLAHPLHYEQIDMTHPLVVRLKEQLERFDDLDSDRLPALLDPLPVIIDVKITEVDNLDAHGHTLLAEHDDAEHHVVAPHGGLPMRPGEIWLLEVQGSRPSTARAVLPDLGEVSSSIAWPTGEWLGKA